MPSSNLVGATFMGCWGSCSRDHVVSNFNGYVFDVKFDISPWKLTSGTQNGCKQQFPTGGPTPWLLAFRNSGPRFVIRFRVVDLHTSYPFESQTSQMSKSKINVRLLNRFPFFGTSQCPAFNRPKMNSANPFCFHKLLAAATSEPRRL